MPQLPGHAADRPLRDYALIGNTYSAALVAVDGSIDWCCLPRFDSPAVLCRLLDVEQGGFFRVGPPGSARATRRYLGCSAVLETVFDTPEGHVRLTDFMPTPPLLGAAPPLDARHAMILRKLEGVTGDVTVDIALRPSFDYARRGACWKAWPNGLTATTGDEDLRLHALPALPLQVAGDTAHARVTLRAGQAQWVVLQRSEPGAPLAAPDDPQRLLDTALKHWESWGVACSYRGPYADVVTSSARVLKLLTFSPDGSIVAAPTASLPEWIGGERNWDYRYCWLRDAALMLHALMSIGHHDAAHEFFGWLSRLWQPGRKLQIMYRIDGGQELREVELRHLRGYRGSRPVRVGNDAAKQTQLDIFGHLLDAAHVYLEGMRRPAEPGLARVLSRLADAAADQWRQPDQGLWEMRTPPAHHVSSKLQCWVALDRALRLARAGQLQGDVRRWAAERDALCAAIHRHGFNERLGAYTQVFDGNTLDASVLQMPIVGFLSPHDPRMWSTVERIRQQLSDNGLVYRYRAPDGVSGSEAPVAICTLWLVEVLVLQGRVDEARALYEHVLGFANDVGLLSEEIDPAGGELLGNYPQGYTHLALIRCALAFAQAQPTGRGSP